MAVVEKERAAKTNKQIGQWRGSDDGITWTPWYALLALNQKVDRYFYYQARLLINGQWAVSKIERDEF